jgi:hypothetical protein
VDNHDFIWQTSVPLADGGDAHIHPWEDQRGFTATTRRLGAFEDHVGLRFREIFGQYTPPCPDVLRRLP